MNTPHPLPECYTAFINNTLLAVGSLEEVVTRLHACGAQSTSDTVFWLFEDASGRNLELNLHAPLADTLAQVRAQCMPSVEMPAPAPVPAGRGRPKLGVVAREVTLLPQHWEWLASQPGGASVALRKLVHAASRAGATQDRARQSLEAAHRFMMTMGGSLPGFEEVTRAMFRWDFPQAIALLEHWPKDIRHYATQLLKRADADAQLAQASAPAA